MFGEYSITINWSTHLVSTGTVLNAHMFSLIYCKGKNSVSRPLQFGQLELSRMELPTLDKGQDTNPRSYQIHNPQSYTGPWFYYPIVRWGPVWAESFQSQDWGWLRKAPRTGYWNNHSGILSLKSLPDQLKIHLILETVLVSSGSEYQPHTRSVLKMCGIG